MWKCAAVWEEDLPQHLVTVGGAPFVMQIDVGGSDILAIAIVQGVSALCLIFQEVTA